MSVQPVTALADTLPPYGNGTLAPGIRSRIVNDNNGLMVHVLEAGLELAYKGAAPISSTAPDIGCSRSSPTP